MFGRFLVLLALSSSLLASPPGEWRIVFLQPEGATWSSAWGAGGGQIVGKVQYPVNTAHPALWDAETGEFIDLLPSWSSYGEAFGGDGLVQVGYVGSPSFQTWPVVWDGAADQLIDLSPGGQYRSGSCNDICDGQQVGYVYFVPSGLQRAALWHGDAASFRDLHPPGAWWSEAFATDGVLQGGRASQLPGTTEIHAVLWHGTAGSWVDMNPPGCRESRIQGMAEGVQVGWGTFSSGRRACLWRGTPESFVDMQPSAFWDSYLYDTTGRFHCGSVTRGGWAEAALWIDDDPESVIHLHSLLGPGWNFSAGRAIAEHNGKLYVAGAAARNGELAQAVVWIGRIPQTDRPPRRPPATTPGQRTKPVTAGPLIP